MVFDLPDTKHADDRDEQHFAVMAASIARRITDLEHLLETARRAPAGRGRQAVDRDDEVRRLTAQLRTLRRYSLDLCLGRMTGEDGEPVYIGRLGLTDSEGRRLLVDWRSPAAEPFFAATHAKPLGLVSRRRYRWTRGRITDYWDEDFTPGSVDGHEGDFIASLGATRSARMRDVLGTIQADQDAIIRASSRGALVVDGGPGTGKTVVALHRTAYLLYADPRLRRRQGGVLLVGPHRPFLSYVADVLPSLGEDDVQTCTLRDLVEEGAAARPETNPEVVRLKSEARMVRAIEAAVRFYEEPPSPDWAEAFAAVSPGTPHNEAREDIWEALDGAKSRAELHRAWPLLDPAELVGDLWSVPAYLRKCAPWLTPAEVRTLQRADPQAWTTADLPLLDAARRRLGDAGAAGRDRRDRARAAKQAEQMDRVVDDLIASHEFDDGEGLMTMLRQQDLRDVLSGEDTGARADALAGTFAHIVVDEAQELTGAEWQMLLARCPSRSFTIVGDRAQARHGFTASWRTALEEAGLTHIEIASLTVNYRTPAEIMAEAEPVIRAALPDANVPTSIRSSGIPVVHGRIEDLERIVKNEQEGTVRVVDSDPELVKGLEFDVVVLVDPQRWSAVDRYVAMTRATRKLVILRGTGLRDRSRGVRMQPGGDT